jgi:arylformamidase
MKLYDITMPITPNMPVYKGLEAKKPYLSTDRDFDTGTAYESRLEMNLHTGTHIDRPLHMIPGGETMGSLNLSQVITPCRVLDLSGVKDRITKEELLKKEIPEGSFLLLKTRNSYENLLESDYIYLERTGAEYLKERKVIGVGIDSLGIERNQPQHETHIQLLGTGAVIMEGLRLKEIEEGEYLLSAAPLNVEGAEAAPVRAYLIKP